MEVLDNYTNVVPLKDSVRLRSAFRTRRARRCTQIEEASMVAYEKEVLLLNKTKIIHLRITEKTLDALQRASKQTGESIAWLIRHSTTYWLQKKGFYIND